MAFLNNFWEDIVSGGRDIKTAVVPLSFSRVLSSVDPVLFVCFCLFVASRLHKRMEGGSEIGGEVRRKFQRHTTSRDDK